MKKLLTFVSFFVFQAFSGNAQMPDICIAVKTLKDVQITQDSIKFRASGTVKLCVLVKERPEDLDPHYRWQWGLDSASFVDMRADDCLFTIKLTEINHDAETQKKREAARRRTLELIKNYKTGDKIYIAVYEAQITVQNKLVVNVMGSVPWAALPEQIPPHLADMSKADRDKVYWQNDHTKFGIRPPLPVAPMADQEFERLQREAESSGKSATGTK